MKTTKEMNIYEAAVFLRMSPRLIRWFTRHTPKKGHSERLAFEIGENDEPYFDENRLRRFDRYLAEPWPSKKSGRPEIPAGIRTEVKLESRCRCVICSHVNGQLAHIDPVHNSKNNHPHNLIYLCPNCHDLYDKRKLITQKEIRSLKTDILDIQVSIWRSQAGLLRTVFLLVRALELVLAKIEFSKFKAYAVIQDQLLQTIKTRAKASASVRENPTLAEKILSFCDGDNEIDNLIQQRNDLLTSSHTAVCPLCEGTGDHNNGTCPVCRGEGTIDARDAEKIDLSPFEQEACPLCEGTGDHNDWICPVCRGEGTIDARDAEKIDLSLFEQVECPLCGGTSDHNNGICPVCRGEGTIDARDAEEIDLLPFEQEACPLCEGTGDHNNGICPVCRGEGTIDARDAEEIDLSLFEQVECPLCGGTGDHNNGICPVCRGEGTIDARDAEKT